jgi:anaerobic ribonucleoside-triphosphate reductase activating protein
MEWETLKIHSIERGSYANGPGKRLVLWTQGCSIKCAGCWNPETHDDGGTLVTVGRILEELVDGTYSGLTITGGEPFDQAEAIFQLGASAKEKGFSSIVFSGFSYSVINRRHGLEKLTESFDVILSDPYTLQPDYESVIQALSNKTVTFLTDRHSHGEFQSIPPCEVFIGRNGEVRLTGLSVPRIA